jgi:hypothetical protein
MVGVEVRVVVLEAVLVLGCLVTEFESLLVGVERIRKGLSVVYGVMFEE